MAEFGRRSVLIVAAASLVGLGGCSGKGAADDVETAKAPTTTTAATATATKGGGSVPTSLTIPSIRFDRKVTGMGLSAVGEISPPPGVTQWYNATVSPGQNGISVIAGHVTFNGPDVFVDLDKVKVDDHLAVGFADGTNRTFIVTRVKSVDKDALRHDQTVWGASSTPVLALITCDASSKLVGAHHTNNFVVWAKPVT